MKTKFEDGVLSLPDMNIVLYNQNKVLEDRDLYGWAKIDYYDLDEATIKKMLISCRQVRNGKSFDNINAYINDLNNLIEHKRELHLKELTIRELKLTKYGLWVTFFSVIISSIFNIISIYSSI